jgi:hypothetical protein
VTRCNVLNNLRQPAVPQANPSQTVAVHCRQKNRRAVWARLQHSIGNCESWKTIVAKLGARQAVFSAIAGSKLITYTQHIPILLPGSVDIMGLFCEYLFSVSFY